MPPEQALSILAPLRDALRQVALLAGGLHRLSGTRTHGRPVAGLFPEAAKLSTETRDSFEHRMFRPVFSALGALLSRLRWLQHGRLQLYVLYVAAALFILLVWRLGLSG